MSSRAFTLLFVFFLAAMLCVRLWLALRHISHINAHRDRVPDQFAEKISLSAHQKAADYTIEKTRFGLITMAANTIVLLGFTLFGGLQWLSQRLHDLTGSGMFHQISLLAIFAIISGLIDLPFSYYSQFVLEQKYGFNKMTLKIFILDMVKGGILGAFIGLPLSWIILTLMYRTGDWWWLYAWAFWSVFQLLMLVLYPTVIAPLFNKFTPLADEELRTRIEGLMKRVGFAAKGLFVMDGSKRSAHGNAYFTGFGKAKRIVFFDTLLSSLSPVEIEAVLAHELGHFKLKHVIKRMVLSFALSLGFLWLLGYLKDQIWFYAGLGIDPASGLGDNAIALLLFALVLPVFTFFFAPLMSFSSRKHEFEADAFAAHYADAHALVSALVKMYEDNASTLTPDPLHSAFYDSHPPAAIRTGRLLEMT